jgi:hypothetical protein
VVSETLAGGLGLCAHAVNALKRPVIINNTIVFFMFMDWFLTNIYKVDCKNEIE